MEWQRWATRESTDTVDENGPLWNDVWGMKIMRDRKIMYDQFPEFRAEARAGSDLGLIWA
jgi:hypothetical protein